MKLYSYDITEFNFKEQLQTVLNTSKLDNLDENKDIERLYSDYLSGKQFLDMYAQFIRKYITKYFSPINCDYGQFVHWGGCNLLHGNKFNNTNKTRLSIDFRVYKYKALLHPDYSLLNF